MTDSNTTHEKRRDALRSKTERQLSATKEAHSFLKERIEMGKQIVGLSLAEAIKTLGPRIASVDSRVSDDVVESKLFDRGKLVDDPFWTSVTHRSISNSHVVELQHLRDKEYARQEAKRRRRKKTEEIADACEPEEDDQEVKRQRQRRKHILFGRTRVFDTA